MKKLSLSLLYIASFAAIATFTTSCGGDDEPVTPAVVDEDSCATSVYPENTGDSELEVLNYSSSVIEVEAETDLTLALQITKGTNRAKKVRLYTSACENIIGTEEDLSDQPKGGKNGIDLRATDEAQIRNVIYTVPTGYTTIYLTLQVEEAGTDIYTYTQLTLNVTGSGIVDEWEDVVLGGNTNANASRLSSGTGLSYTACNAAANIEYIDITYAVSIDGENAGTPYISSNPARFESPIALGAASASCGEDGDLATDGGNAAYFASSDVDFDTATDTELSALSVSSEDNEYVEMTGAGQVIQFINTDGKKGLIKIESVTDGDTDYNGSIEVSVKVQR